MVWIYAAALHLFLPLLVKGPLPFTFILPMIFSLKKIPLPLFLSLCALSGLFVDCFDSSLPIGAHALIFLITGALANAFHHFFFSDKFISIAFFSMLLSVTITFQLLALRRGIHLKGASLISEFLICPLIDSLYCLFHFGLKKVIKRIAYARP